MPRFQGRQTDVDSLGEKQAGTGWPVAQHTEEGAWILTVRDADENKWRDSARGIVIGASYVADTTETELIGEYDAVLERLRRRFEHGTADCIDQSDTTLGRRRAAARNRPPQAAPVDRA